MTLLGGDPGIGKSTLLLQLAGMLVEPQAIRSFTSSSSGEDDAALQSPQSSNPVNGASNHGMAVDPHLSDDAQSEEPGVLYVSAEESAEQVLPPLLCSLHLLRDLHTAFLLPLAP